MKGGIRNVSPCNKQTTRLVKKRARAYERVTYTGGIVEVAKNIKRRGGERHRVFGQLNISIFNFSLALSVGARSAVSLWLTIVDSFIADLSVPPPCYPPPSLPLSLSLSLYLVSSPRLSPSAHAVLVSLLLQFFSWFSISSSLASPRSIDNPAIRITLENRTDTKQLFNAAYRGFGLSLVEIRQNPAYRNASCTR